MKTYKTLLICVAIFCAQFANAQEARMPVLTVAGEEASEVYLQSLDIQVEVIGNIATTRYTMVFKNRTNKILEGSLLFPLPEGVTVSHYALDIDGKMREAVPVEKAKATQVFEEIVQRRVDPGLLERVEGNNFRTRIYPVFANGIRTVSIGYEEELPIENGKFYYRLPMAYPEAIEQFTLKATVWKSFSTPQIEGRLSEELVFDRQGENFVATFSRNNYQADRALIFSLPIPADIPQILMQPASGSFYYLASCVPNPETRPKTWGNNIGVIWDVSLSGLHRNHEKELDVLEQIIQNKKNLTVNLYFLNNRFVKNGVFTISNGNWSALRNVLETAIYDGGTNFEAIDIQPLCSDEYLFFSDGLSTLSDVDFIAKNPYFANIPVHCIVSSAKADYSSMRWIAAQTNGKFINLNALSALQIQEELTRETLHFLGIENNQNVRETHPSVSTPVRGNFSIAGILDGSHPTSLVLKFGFGNDVQQRITINLNPSEAAAQANVHRIWAQKKIAELDMRYHQNIEELTELGQQFGIVTRNTSLIVLETLQDYITFNIVPPAELRDEFFRVKKEAEQRRGEQNLMMVAVAAARNLKTWWDMEFTPQKPRFPTPDDATNEPQQRSSVDNQTARAEASSVGNRRRRSTGIFRRNIIYYPLFIIKNSLHRRPSNEFSDSDIEAVSEIEAWVARVLNENPSNRRRSRSYYARANEVFMDASMPSQARSNAPQPRSSASQPEIVLVPIKQENTYIAQLTGNLDNDYALYLKLRDEYINTPTFYFDIADWFYSHDDRERALRILTNIAELDLENASLFRLLGYRLKQYEEYAMQLYICAKVIEWRPMEPQSYRDYALALANNGYHQAALDSLYGVLTRYYPRNIAQRSRGIEEATVTEINRLAVKYPHLRTDHISEELIIPIAVDIRVVINWNMDNTDIDLHVIDPHGEVCYYSNRQTAMGGRISYDNRSGYGPEQFLLKKAVPGTYKVYINYFSDRQVKAEGPSTIMAEIFTLFSDKTEQRQVVCLQLSGNRERSKLLVAEFKF